MRMGNLFGLEILVIFIALNKLKLFPQNAQQSVHLTLGILRQSQAVSYAFSFFWLDGFAVPAPAQVTQTVGRTNAEVTQVRKKKSFEDWHLTNNINRLVPNNIKL